jgi:GPH family glycoside/pentoside/hexuronide:cation symporter
MNVSINGVVTYSIGLIYYLGKWEMSLVWLYIAQLCSTITGTYTKVYVGYLSDKMETKYGRRKPMVAMGIMLQMLSGALLCIPPNKDNNLLLSVWYVVFFVICDIGYNIATIPFSSWLLESSLNTEDYTRINAIASQIGSAFGYIIGLAILYFVEPMYSGLFNLCFGSLTLAAILHYIPSNVITKLPDMPPLIPSVRTCMSSGLFQKLFINRILIYAVVGISGSASAYITALGFNYVQTNNLLVKVLLIQGIVLSLLAIPVGLLTNYLLNYIETIDLYQWTTIGYGFSCLILFISVISNKTFFFFESIFTLLSLVFTAVSIMDTLLIRELIILDTFQTGFNREALYQTTLYTAQGMVSSIITYIPTIVYFMSGLSIAYSDSDDDIIVNHYNFDNTTLWLLRIFLSLVPACCALLAYFVMRTYPLRKNVANKINEVLRLHYYESSNDDDDLTINILANDHNEVMNSNINESDIEDELMKANKRDIDYNDKMLYFHLSIEELQLISNSDCCYEKIQNDGLQKIIYLNAIGLFIALTAIPTLLAGSIIQIMAYSTSMISVQLTLLLVVSFYLLYEILRFSVIQKLKKMHSVELKNTIISVLEKDENSKVLFRGKLDKLFRDDDHIKLVVDQLYKESPILTIVKGYFNNYMLVYGLLICIQGIAVYGILY